MKTIPQQIEALGWHIESATAQGFKDEHYRAYQGGFKTLWRPDISQTLKDVESICKARKEAKDVPF